MNSKNLQINKIKEDLVATLQTLVADEEVRVEFDEELRGNFFVWNQNLVKGKEVVLPEVRVGEQILKQVQDDDVGSLEFQSENEFRHPDPSTSSGVSGSICKFRAAGDLAACYLLFHDSQIHQQKNFSNEEQKFFDDFEKIRVLVSVREIYLGAAKNILEKIEEDIFSTEENLSLLLLDQFFDEEILPRTRNFILELKEKTDKRILQEIKNLAKDISNQRAFASSVERLIDLLKKEKDVEEKEENPQENNEAKNQLTNFGAENIDSNQQKDFPQNGEEESTQQIDENQKISELKDDEKKGEISVKSQKVEEEKAQKIEFINPYKIFTSQFDEVIFPQKLVAKADLEMLRDQLDLRIAKLSTISKKMSLKLKRKLLSKRNSFLEFDSSRGILDRKKLTRLVIDPMFENIWVNNRNHEYQDTALTILLDNSGSMRGNPIVMSALACEIIAQILEKFSVKTEIIGFTTADWKGGRARKLWESSSRPKNPGRLNELRHIIYKHFNQSFKKSKINLGLMLKEGILKENIDGEALLFARSRLMQQSEKRKILLVISDGTPVDDSTALANDSDILSDHLKHVINKIEKSAKIEIVGIGIGHTTEEFYRNSIAIKSLEELGDVMVEKIADLL